jgi:hypothetical protein
MKALTATFLALILIFASEAISAHGGGLDSKGCHNNRKTGDYHCHRVQPSAKSETNSLSSAQRFTAGRAFRNCAEARAAGAAPARREEPGYGPHLDHDSDGVGCE